MPADPNPAPFYPERVPLDAYGNGGFRFAGTSHRGSLLILSDGVRGWHIEDFCDLTVDDFSQVLAEPDGLEFILLGTGERQRFPSAAIRDAFAGADIGLEVMATGAACRTFNVLLAEERAVGAALIAVP